MPLGVVRPIFLIQAAIDDRNIRQLPGFSTEPFERDTEHFDRKFLMQTSEGFFPAVEIAGPYVVQLMVRMYFLELCTQLGRADIQ